jgi:hypothetical protein
MLSSVAQGITTSKNGIPTVTVMAVATDFHRTFLTPLARISATDILLYYFYCITEKLFVKTDKKTNGVCGTDSPNFYPLYNPKLIFCPLRYA